VYFLLIVIGGAMATDLLAPIGQCGSFAEVSSKIFVYYTLLFVLATGIVAIYLFFRVKHGIHNYLKNRKTAPTDKQQERQMNDQVLLFLFNMKSMILIQLRLTRATNLTVLAFVCFIVLPNVVQAVTAFSK
jgi:hypothetical protein